MKFKNSKFSSVLEYFGLHRETEPAFYVSVCCIIKDENEYLAEWIDYHRKIGAEHFFIYDNGSKVAVADTIAALGAGEYVTVTVIQGRNKHIKAYDHCLKNFGRHSRWIAFIDVDEFIVPKTDNPKLGPFLEDYEDYGGLGVSWLIFGSNGHIKKPAGSQLENFTMRSPASFLANKHIKSIVQPRYTKSAFKSHCFKYKPGYSCVNEHYAPIGDSFAESSTNKIQLNHYYCRSLEEYHQKITRGISDTKRPRQLDEFHYHDSESNVVKDTSVLEVLKKIKKPEDGVNF